MRKPATARLLRDCVRPPIDVLFVGINPGIRSAGIGHHFAGYSNRFWPLLADAGLIPEGIRAEDDRRLPEWGLGVTNLIARPTPGIDTLRPAEYTAGLRQLRRKVRRWKPAIVVFVGVTVYRAIRAAPRSAPLPLGRQPEPFEGAEVFVVPNPSGRNAAFSYAEMRAAFKAVARRLRQLRRRPARSVSEAGHDR